MLGPTDARYAATAVRLKQGMAPETQALELYMDFLCTFEANAPSGIAEQQEEQGGTCPGHHLRGELKST